MSLVVLRKIASNETIMCVVENFGKISCAGDCENTFTIQSIIKPIILLMLLMDKGIARVHGLVGVEATGKFFDAFNYSGQALSCEHINPMINTGAIALCTLIEGKSYKEKFLRLLNLTRKMTDNPLLGSILVRESSR